VKRKKQFDTAWSQFQQYEPWQKAATVLFSYLVGGGQIALRQAISANPPRRIEDPAFPDKSAGAKLQQPAVN
jgi:hypothetical protein